MSRPEAFDARSAEESASSSVMLAELRPQDMFKVQGVQFENSAKTGDFQLTQAQAQSVTEKPDTPAGKAMSEAVTGFQKELAERKAKNGKLAETDFGEILPKYYPKMKEAISLADTSAAQGRKEAADEYLRVKPDLQAFGKAFPQAMERFSNASNAVPVGEDEKVGKLLTELTGDKTAAERKSQIRQELAKYPDLTDSAEHLFKVKTDADAKFEKLNAAVEKMQTGLGQSLMFRGFYSQAITQGFGNPAEAEQATKEAQMISQLYVKAMTAPQTLFMPPEELVPPKPLPPLRQA